MSVLDFEIPGYDILERIGKGGMASVYRARQHTFDRNVALKILKPDLSEDDAFCQRFVMESLIVAKLNHSHIVQVYDVGEVSNNYFIAMEFLSGGDLHSRLQDGLSVDDAVSITKQMASALNFGHNKSIIHRDLKPDNVMFREDGAAVLTDFGIAKETNADINLTQTGLIVGTPKYMSPEQIRGAAPSPAGDIYSLGIMFFQLLTNRVPFSGADLVATAYQHFNEPVPPLPASLSRFQPLIEHMLAKQVEDRIQHGSDIVKALERIERTHSQRPAAERAKDGHPIDDDETIVAPTRGLEENSDNDATRVSANPSAPTKLSERGEAIQHQEHHSGKEREPSSYDETRVESAVPSNKNTHQEASNNTNATITISMTKKPIYLVGGLGLAAIVAVLFFVLQAGSPEQPASASNQSSQTAGIEQSKRRRVDNLLRQAQTLVQRGDLQTPISNNAYDKYLAILTIDPQHPEALVGIQDIAERYLVLTEQAISKNKLDAAQDYLDRAKNIAPSMSVAAQQQSLDVAFSQKEKPKENILSRKQLMRISGLLQSAAIDEAEGRLFSPSGKNAQEKYQRVLAIDPQNNDAKTKLLALEKQR